MDPLVLYFNIQYYIWTPGPDISIYLDPRGTGSAFQELDEIFGASMKLLHSPTTKVSTQRSIN